MCVRYQQGSLWKVPDRVPAFLMFASSRERQGLRTSNQEKDLN
jgi:hypothetical protein